MPLEPSRAWPAMLRCTTTAMAFSSTASASATAVDALVLLSRRTKSSRSMCHMSCAGSFERP
jgi:hypothetical protein